MDEHSRRWAFVGAFAMMTQYVMYFFDGAYFWNPGDWENAEWKLKYSWIRRKRAIFNESLYFLNGSNDFFSMMTVLLVTAQSRRPQLTSVGMNLSILNYYIQLVHTVVVRNQ